jgi:hypothetical protein
MNEYLEKIHSIISDARMSVKEESEKALKNVTDEMEQKKIKLASIHYEVMLSEILLYKKDIEESIIDKAKMANNTGVKIVMDTEPGDNLSSDSYAYEGEVDAFVSDKDPVVVETKSGKKIVLDEDPKFYISKTGKKIVLDEDPKFKKAKTGNKIKLDEDPLSIMTKTGKKIILDSDPVSNKVRSNKVIVLSEDPIFKLTKTGNKFVLDEEPKFNTSKTGNKIKLDQDPMNITIEA